MSLAHNHRALFDYEVLEKFEAGLELYGYEVKAIKAGKMSLAGSHVIIRGEEAYLVGATIQAYQAANLPPDFVPDRTLRLLLTKRELKRLAGTGRQKGLTMVPISAYNKGGKIKLEFALGRGKKKYDKRETIKKRDAKRQIQRSLKMENPNS